MDNKNGKTVKDCLELLSSQTEWIERFAGYADSLVNNRSNYGRRKFSVRKPLTIYTSIDKAQRSAVYDIRYKDQSVGTVKVSRNGKVTLSSTPKKDKRGHFYFGWDKQLNKSDWNGKDATNMLQAISYAPKRMFGYNIEDKEDMSPFHVEVYDANFNYITEYEWECHAPKEAGFQEMDWLKPVDKVLAVIRDF